MSLITAKSFNGSTAHGYLQRCVANFEANCVKIATRIHRLHDMPYAPVPSITDAIVTLVENDDVLCAQMFGPDLHPSFEIEIAAVAATAFGKFKDDFEPSARDVRKVIGKRLTEKVFDFLSLSEKLAIVRTMTKGDAVTFCEKRLRHRAINYRDSIASNDGAATRSNKTRAALSEAMRSCP